MSVSNDIREPLGLLTEQEIVSSRDLCARVQLSGMPAEGDQPSGASRGFQEGLEARVMVDIHLGPVIQAGTPEMPVVHPETERVDQMQPQLRRSAQASNVSRIGRDLRLIEDDMQPGFIEGTACHLLLSVAGLRNVLRITELTDHR